MCAQFYLMISAINSGGTLVSIHHVEAVTVSLERG